MAEHRAPRGARRRDSRRLRALLAGGVVLGVGAAITLASWNDSEFATGTFAAGSFNLEGTTDNGTWGNHATTGTAAQLGFSVSPSNMSPGDVYYSPFAVRLDAATTYNSTVTVSMAGTSGTLTNMTYKIIEPSSWGCDATTTGTTLVAAGTALNAVPGSTTFNLSKGSPPTTAGTPVYLCYVVTAGSITQGQSGTATWGFTAQSQ